MSKFEELVNDFTIMGDDGAVIFSSYDRFVEFIEEIVVDERKREREACAKNERKRKTLAELLSATPVDAVNMSEEHVDETAKGVHEWVGFTDGEKKYLRALGYVGIEDIESRLKRMNT